MAGNRDHEHDRTAHPHGHEQGHDHGHDHAAHGHGHAAGLYSANRLAKPCSVNRELISHKAFSKSFCKSQFSQKSVNSFYVLVIMTNLYVSNDNEGLLLMGKVPL